MQNPNAYEKRVQWFRDARFGMFIHWGLYAIPARGEWVRSHEKISVESYQPYFDSFNPIDFDPKAWAKAAKEAGMRYAVLTAKHHDGFCLFDSRLTDYKITNTPYGQDAVRAFLEAFRAEGLKVGLYYSLLDWHHPDYPHYGDPYHPMRDNEAFKGQSHQFDRYLDYMHGQIREICTNYGQIDLLWFDFSYNELRDEAWRATKLMNMIKELQPQALCDNRLEASGEGFGSLLSDNPSLYSGDFVSPEQIIPPEGIRNERGEPVTWEACITMNNHWGYCHNDHYYKPASMVVRKLTECVSKGGNLLLNVGPDARGRIPKPSLKILKQVGEWMAQNSESIYACGIAGLEKPDYGRVTRKGRDLYFHVMDAPVGYTALSGVKESEIEFIRLLSSGAELPYAKDCFAANYPNMTFVSLGENPVLPDETDTVIHVRLKG